MNGKKEEVLQIQHKSFERIGYDKQVKAYCLYKIIIKLLFISKCDCVTFGTQTKSVVINYIYKKVVKDKVMLLKCTKQKE